jgi:hypothetical protein
MSAASPRVFPLTPWIAWTAFAAIIFTSGLLAQTPAPSPKPESSILVTLEKLTVKSASVPGSEDKGRAWASMIQAGSANLRPISLERFESAVASTGAQRRGEAVPVKNDPPQIEISTVPSMPVLIDGEPIYREVPHTSLMRVMNTRPLLLRDASGTYYLKVFDGWMQAPSLTGKWTVAASVPSACDIALKAAIEQKAVDLLVGGDPKDPRSAPSLKT